MQHPANPHREPQQRLPRPFLGEPPNPDHPLGGHRRHQPAQVLVARPVQRLRLRHWQLVRGQVRSRLRHEHQRTVVGHEMFPEEPLRRAELRREKTPQPPPTHLALPTPKPFHRPLRMLRIRPPHLPRQPHPIPYRRDLPEWHPRLRHAIRPRIHAEKHHSLRTSPEPIQVRPMNPPGILQRVVYPGHRPTEPQPPHRPRQCPRRRPRRLRRPPRTIHRPLPTHRRQGRH